MYKIHLLKLVFEEKAFEEIVGRQKIPYPIQKNPIAKNSLGPLEYILYIHRIYMFYTVCEIRSVCQWL